MAEQQNEKFATIACCRDLPLAGLIQSRLESAGIRCFLDNEFMVGINWLYSNALGGIQVKVLQQDAATALEILEEPPLPPAEEKSGSQEIAARCPHCGSTEVILHNTTRKAGALSLLLGLPLILFRKKWHCRDCGQHWK